jgi:hypothetical protein
VSAGKRKGVKKGIKDARQIKRELDIVDKITTLNLKILMPDYSDIAFNDRGVNFICTGV